MKAVCFTLLLTGLANLIGIEASPFGEETKIVGGRVAKKGAYPWEVSLGLMEGVPTDKGQREYQWNIVKLSTHICGGVLIHKDWVVTAAHCVVPFKDPSVSLGVGVGQRGLTEIFDTGRIPVASAIVHPKYTKGKPSSPYDVALLKLSQSAETKGLACLDSTDRSYGKKLVAIGWGNTKKMTMDTKTNVWSGTSPAEYLKEANMEDVSSGAGSCSERPDLICIEPVTSGDASCKGDSGGSLVYQDDLVVGLTSFGGSKQVGRNKIQTCNGDSAYTRSSKYIEWIEKNINATICTK